MARYFTLLAVFVAFVAVASANPFFFGKKGGNSGSSSYGAPSSGSYGAPAKKPSYGSSGKGKGFDLSGIFDKIKSLKQSKINAIVGFKRGLIKAITSKFSGFGKGGKKNNGGSYGAPAQSSGYGAPAQSSGYGAPAQQSSGYGAPSSSYGK